MPGLGALWDSLVDCICRPPRDEYLYPDELVGGSRKLFRVGRCPGIREDLTLTNKRGLALQCSHYLPKHVRGKDGRLPCVIYCHCNSGSRRDAEEAICVLIPCGVSVFTLDFAGSGLSEGQWVTLGAEEVDDVSTVVEHLRAGGGVSTLGLWGRSMGAVTALLYSQRDPSIAGMVLDSPFARLTDLMLEIVQEQKLPIPRALAKLALAAMKRSVMKRAGFDITKVSPVDAVSQSFIPALFGHATGDTFIRISHAEALHGAYAGDKNLIRFEGDHNSRRPEFFYNSVSIFWHNTLQLEHLLEPTDLGSLHTTTLGATSTLGAGPGGSTGASGGSGSGRHGAGRALRPPPARLRHPNPALALSADPAAAGGAAGNGAAAGGKDAAAGAGANDAGGEEDEGADVAGVAARSAPWEPRLWETDADKAAREKQRFRRMAGGLPSPPLTSALGGAAADGPLGGGGGAAGSSGGGGGRVGFRNSAELAQLLANTSDESLAERLLGEGPQRSDRPTMVAAAAEAGRGLGPAVAAPLPPNPRLVTSLMAAAMLLPETEEEEEAQLAAALQLSLLEAEGTAYAGDGGPLAAAAAKQPDAAAAATATAGAGTSGPGSATQAGVGGESQGRIDATARATATPSLIYPDVILAGPPPQATAAPAAGAAVTAGDLAATTTGVVLPRRSNSHEDARLAPPLAAMPPAALSGPAHPGPEPEAGAAAGSAVTALLDAAAAAAEGQPPAAKPQERTSGGGPVAAGAAAAEGRPSSGGRGGVAASPGAAAAAAAVTAVGGLSVYDLYTEDELMSLAMQLSLQESAAAAAPAPLAPASSGAAAGAPGGLPSLL